MSIQAEELVLYLKKGGQVSFALEKKPVITFVRDTIVINSEITNYSVSISEIENMILKNLQQINND